MSYKPDAKSIEIANLIAEIDSKIQARAKLKKTLKEFKQQLEKSLYIQQL